MIQIDSSSLIIYDGAVYGLTVKEKFCPEAQSYNPCHFCALLEQCASEDSQFCTVFGATKQEFYVFCGVIKVEQDTHQIHVFPINGYQFI